MLKRGLLPLLAVAACQSALRPVNSAPTCVVTVTPAGGSLDATITTTLTAENAATCTYSVDGKGNIPVACNATFSESGAQSGGVGAHKVTVTATAPGSSATCEAAWSITSSTSPPDMGSNPADMLAATPPDMSGPSPSPDMTAPPTMLDLQLVTLFNNPPNLVNWPVTTTITNVQFELGGDGIHVEFSKRDGAGSWPDVTPPGWGGPLQYTLGMVEFINGQWYGSAAIQFWRGLPSSGGNVAMDTVTMGQCQSFGAGSPCQVAANWYYDGRWGQLAGYQPATGEIIGLFVVAGNTRGVMADDPNQSPVMERSNVVLMPFPGIAGAQYAF